MFGEDLLGVGDSCLVVGDGVLQSCSMVVDVVEVSAGLVDIPLRPSLRPFDFVGALEELADDVVGQWPVPLGRSLERRRRVRPGVRRRDDRSTCA